MDAKEVLRRYLEQRREAGESELVLDGLSVEEALRLIGVPLRSKQASPTLAQGSEVQTEVAGKGPADWRTALRAAQSPPAGQSAIRQEGPPVRESPIVQESPTVRKRPSVQVRPPVEEVSTVAPPSDEVPQETIGGGRLGFDVTVAPATEGVGPGAGDKVPQPGLSDFPQGIIVGTGGRELFYGPDSPYASLDDIVKAVASCRLCPLAREAKNPVPGTGNPQAGLVCVGEAPGATEDEMGVPFVGQAGQLLTKILAAINLAREDVYICNVLKHRPPGNRNPLPSEVDACTPYLVRQIELIRPKVIVAFGTFAAQTLLNTKESIGKLRGKVHRYYGVPLVVTYHPAALLRNPAWKRPTWEDVQLARRLLDRAAGGQ
ncbi:MAG: uracil-DNA glycosylase [Gemmatimonadaceae bacterium]